MSEKEMTDECILSAGPAAPAEPRHCAAVRTNSVQSRTVTRLTESWRIVVSHEASHSLVWSRCSTLADAGLPPFALKQLLTD